MTLESANTSVSVPVYANLKRVENVNAQIATTLCARDYKGFGTGFNTMNGVLEWK